MFFSDITFANMISVTEYNSLRKSAGWKEIEINQAQIGLNNSAYLVAAVYEGKTIGMARLVSDGGYVVIIVDVIVLPEFQGKGIGKSMLKLVLDFIKINISKGEAVLVNLMAAKGRESFYKQFGFDERPNEKLGAGMTQWISK